MKNIVLFISILLFLGCKAKAQEKKMEKKKYKVEKTDEEWRASLTAMQYSILRHAGTERAWTSEFNDFKGEGTFVCAGCETPLYESDHKYNSGSGWPSFDKGIEENIELGEDYKIGYKRVELKCNTCGGHLGHWFNDGPRKTTGERHCINGAVLKFVPSE